MSILLALQLEGSPFDGLCGEDVGASVLDHVVLEDGSLRLLHACGFETREADPESGEQLTTSDSSSFTGYVGAPNTSNDGVLAVARYVGVGTVIASEQSRVAYLPMQRKGTTEHTTVAFELPEGTCGGGSEGGEDTGEPDTGEPDTGDTSAPRDSAAEQDPPGESERRFCGVVRASGHTAWLLALGIALRRRPTPSRSRPQ